VEIYHEHLHVSLCSQLQLEPEVLLGNSLSQPLCGASVVSHRFLYGLPYYTRGAGTGGGAG